MKTVHIGTVIQSTFGVLDDDGNVIPGEPIAINAPVFSVERFTDAHRMIGEERDRRTSDEPGQGQEG